MSSGPYLYDDNPEPLHTGEGRRRTGTVASLLPYVPVTAALATVLVSSLAGAPRSRGARNAVPIVDVVNSPPPTGWGVRSPQTTWTRRPASWRR